MKTKAIIATIILCTVCMWVLHAQTTKMIHQVIREDADKVSLLTMNLMQHPVQTAQWKGKYILIEMAVSFQNVKPSVLDYLAREKKYELEHITNNNEMVISFKHVNPIIINEGAQEVGNIKITVYIPKYIRQVNVIEVGEEEKETLNAKSQDSIKIESIKTQEAVETIIPIDKKESIKKKESQPPKKKVIRGAFETIEETEEVKGAFE